MIAGVRMGGRRPTEDFELAASRPDGYHHGDLPAALLTAVDEIVREGGVGAVSLREAARRAGVTHAAPAHHFGDKAGLLTAFAAEGFRRLREHLAGAVAAATEAGEPDCLQLGLAYVDFAVRHPGHFAVMFRPENLHVHDEEYRGAGLAAFEVLLDAVGALRPDLGPHDPQVVSAATGAWAMAHGFATLWLEGDLSELVGDKDAQQAATDAFTGFGMALHAAGIPTPPTRAPRRASSRR